MDRALEALEGLCLLLALAPDRGLLPRPGRGVGGDVVYSLASSWQNPLGPPEFSVAHRAQPPPCNYLHIFLLFSHQELSSASRLRVWVGRLRARSAHSKHTPAVESARAAVKRPRSDLSWASTSAALLFISRLALLLLFFLLSTMCVWF